MTKRAQGKKVNKKEQETGIFRKDVSSLKDLKEFSKSSDWPALVVSFNKGALNYDSLENYAPFQNTLKNAWICCGDKDPKSTDELFTELRNVHEKLRNWLSHVEHDDFPLSLTGGQKYLLESLYSYAQAHHENPKGSDDPNLFEKKGAGQESVAESQNKLTVAGLIFIANLFLSQKDAYLLMQQIKGLKGKKKESQDFSKGADQRQKLFTYYSLRDGRISIETGTQEKTVWDDVLLLYQVVGAQYYKYSNLGEWAEKEAKEIHAKTGISEEKLRLKCLKKKLIQLYEDDQNLTLLSAAYIERKIPKLKFAYLSRKDGQDRYSFEKKEESQPLWEKGGHFYIQLENKFDLRIGKTAFWMLLQLVLEGGESGFVGEAKTLVNKATGLSFGKIKDLSAEKTLPAFIRNQFLSEDKRIKTLKERIEKKIAQERQRVDGYISEEKEEKMRFILQFFIHAAGKDQPLSKQTVKLLRHRLSFLKDEAVFWDSDLQARVSPSDREQLDTFFKELEDKRPKGVTTSDFQFFFQRAQEWRTSQLTAFENEAKEKASSEEELLNIARKLKLRGGALKDYRNDFFGEAAKEAKEKDNNSFTSLAVNKSLFSASFKQKAKKKEAEERLQKAEERLQKAEERLQKAEEKEAKETLKKAKERLQKAEEKEKEAEEKEKEAKERFKQKLKKILDFNIQDTIEGWAKFYMEGEGYKSEKSFKNSFHTKSNFIARRAQLVSLLAKRKMEEKPKKRKMEEEPKKRNDGPQPKFLLVKRPLFQFQESSPKKSTLTLEYEAKVGEGQTQEQETLKRVFVQLYLKDGFRVYGLSIIQIAKVIERLDSKDELEGPCSVKYEVLKKAYDRYVEDSSKRVEKVFSLETNLLEGLDLSAKAALRNGTGYICFKSLLKKAGETEVESLLKKVGVTEAESLLKKAGVTEVESLKEYRNAVFHGDIVSCEEEQAFEEGSNFFKDKNI